MIDVKFIETCMVGVAEWVRRVVNGFPGFLLGFDASARKYSIRSFTLIVFIFSLKISYALNRNFDVVVYGGSASGVIAAVAAARQGASVGLFEPLNHLGGMVSSGLGFTDYGNKNVIGGMSLEFFKRVGVKYDTTIRWTFEPHVAESVFVDMAAEAKVNVFFNSRVREKTGVIKTGTRLAALILENGDTVTAKVFCDASYEGDILAQAGVAYTWGREASSQYGEILAGVRGPNSPNSQFPLDSISAYETGKTLFPEISEVPRDSIGAGDKKIQAYNFRLCMTNVAANRVAFTRPAGYDSTQYKLLARYIQHLVATNKNPTIDYVAKLSKVYGNKTDVNNKGPFSSDYIGHNWDYPDGSYALKAQLWKGHEQYLRGFWYFCGHDPSLPPTFRNTALNWGLDKDEFRDNDNWPFQLYVREGRRMVGEYVMIQKDIQTTRTKIDAIGMGSYQSDSHQVQRIVNAKGFVENEGEMFVSVSPYEIPYRIILPKRLEATNLLVTVCFSSSHVAYSTLRMEPQYMIIGQAAGIAAKLAIDANVNVQDIDIAKLRAELVSQGAVLQLPSAAAIPPRDRIETLSRLSVRYQSNSMTVEWEPASVSAAGDNLELYDTRGRVLGQWNIQAGRSIISLASHEAGIYFVKIKNRVISIISP